MLTDHSDRPTQRVPLPGEMTLLNPHLAWDAMSYEDKGRFLIVAIRTLNHKPLPDPHWQSFVTNGLASLVNGSLVLSPVGVSLMLQVVETEFAWLGDWM